MGKKKEEITSVATTATTNLVKISGVTGVMTIDGIGAVTMPAGAGRFTNTAYKALTATNKSALALAEALSSMRSTEAYKEIHNADGMGVTPTFGDYAETVLKMSKGGASTYATVGDVFGDYFETAWKYSHYTIMLKLRKITDANGEPLTGKEIIEMLEERGATPDASTRKLDEIVSAILCEDAGEEADEEPDAGDGDGAGTDTDEEPESEAISITTAFNVIRSALESNGLYETWGAKLSELENLF